MLHRSSIHCAPTWQQRQHCLTVSNPSFAAGKCLYSSVRLNSRPRLSRPPTDPAKSALIHTSSKFPLHQTFTLHPVHRTPLDFCGSDGYPKPAPHQTYDHTIATTLKSKSKHRKKAIADHGNLYLQCILSGSVQATGAPSLQDHVGTARYLYTARIYSRVSLQSTILSRVS